jgi:hypothetical protein
MLHPVGDLAPSVYWRRRILLVAALILVLLTAYALAQSSGGATGKAAPAGSSSSARPSSTVPATTSSSPSPTPTKSPSAVAVTSCTKTQLTLAAATDAKSYAIGDKPKLALVLTNKGPRPCSTDLADKQIELRVFSGSARVWGSHDCQIQPGTSVQTLPVGRPTRREIEWSGLSSQPSCAGVRQQVPAGNYTLFALLGGQQGSTAAFSFTG